jgi:hypothetical protein
VLESLRIPGNKIADFDGWFAKVCALKLAIIRPCLTHAHTPFLVRRAPFLHPHLQGTVLKALHVLDLSRNCMTVLLCDAARAGSRSSSVSEYGPANELCCVNNMLLLLYTNPCFFLILFFIFFFIFCLSSRAASLPSEAMQPSDAPRCEYLKKDDNLTLQLEP